MHIENKFLRFITSFFLAIVLYIFIGVTIINDTLIESLVILLMFTAYALYVFGPLLFFVGYSTYYLLTPRSNRSKSAVYVFILAAIFLFVAGSFLLNENGNDVMFQLMKFFIYYMSYVILFLLGVVGFWTYHLATKKNNPNKETPSLLIILSALSIVIVLLYVITKLAW